MSDDKPEDFSHEQIAAGIKKLMESDRVISITGTDEALEFSDIIGLSVRDAMLLVKDRGINVIRPEMVDGKLQMGTMDMRTDRLNVSVRDGCITSIGRVK